MEDWCKPRKTSYYWIPAKRRRRTVRLRSKKSKIKGAEVSDSVRRGLLQTCSVLKSQQSLMSCEDFSNRHSTLDQEFNFPSIHTCFIEEWTYLAVRKLSFWLFNKHNRQSAINNLWQAATKLSPTWVNNEFQRSVQRGHHLRCSPTRSAS